jgi:20S proteasome subunit alpha 7
VGLHFRDHALLNNAPCCDSSIHLVHEDTKEKDFELEMTWVCEESGGLHLPVPTDLKEEAEQKAKAVVENFE